MSLTCGFQCGFVKRLAAVSASLSDAGVWDVWEVRVLFGFVYYRVHTKKCPLPLLTTPGRSLFGGEWMVLWLIIMCSRTLAPLPRREGLGDGLLPFQLLVQLTCFFQLYCQIPTAELEAPIKADAKGYEGNDGEGLKEIVLATIRTFAASELHNNEHQIRNTARLS